jgi:ribonuclease VapC
VIVVDTSALIEIIAAGGRAEACMEVLENTDHILVSAGTVVECLIVALGHDAEQPLRDLFDTFGLRVEPVTAARAQAAAAGYRLYGKGRHAARLNFGDSFAYALAKEHDCPLLFVGRDFALTDVTPALPAPASG